MDRLEIHVDDIEHPVGFLEPIPQLGTSENPSGAVLVGATIPLAFDHSSGITEQ